MGNTGAGRETVFSIDIFDYFSTLTDTERMEGKKVIYSNVPANAANSNYFNIQSG